MVKVRALAPEAQASFVAAVERDWRRLGLDAVANPWVTFEAHPGRSMTVETSFDLDGVAFGAGEEVDAAEFVSPARRRALAAATVLACARLVRERLGDPGPWRGRAFDRLLREASDAVCMRLPK